MIREQHSGFPIFPANSFAYASSLCTHHVKLKLEDEIVFCIYFRWNGPTDWVGSGKMYVLMRLFVCLLINYVNSLYTHFSMCVKHLTVINVLGGAAISSIEAIDDLQSPDVTGWPVVLNERWTWLAFGCPGSATWCTYFPAVHSDRILFTNGFKLLLGVIGSRKITQLAKSNCQHSAASTQ